MAPYITPLGYYGYYIVPAGVARNGTAAEAPLAPFPPFFAQSARV
jgi:hypothetical protein